MILVIGFLSQVQAQPQEFNSNAEFIDWLNWHQNQLTDHQDGEDFIFGGGVEYEIPADLIVEILEGGNADGIGVRLRFTGGSSLRVRGVLYCNSDAEGNPISNERPQFYGDNNFNNEPLIWDGIQVIRAFWNDQVNGIAIFNRTDITGGGVWDGDELGNEAQIRVDGCPSVTFNDCILAQSLGHGIYIQAFSGDVTLIRTQILNTRFIEIGEEWFQGSGIRVYIRPRPGGIPIQEVTVGDESHIWNCGYGVHYIAFDREDEVADYFLFQLISSEISHNWDTGLRVEGNHQRVFFPQIWIGDSRIQHNGQSGEGWGINMDNIHNIFPPNADLPDMIWFGPLSMVNVYDNTEINNNAWGGARFWDVNPAIIFRNSFVFLNGHGIDDREVGANGQVYNFVRGQGIKVRLWRKSDADYHEGEAPGVQSYLLVQDCDIYENGFQGISVAKGRNDASEIIPGADWIFGDHVCITGNRISNNAVNCDLHNERDARRGSNIHILEVLNHVNISHNIIKGAETGVCWDVTQNEDEERPPAQRIAMRNNVIRDAGLYGFFCRRYKNGKWRNFVVNNAFWDNGRENNAQVTIAQVRYIFDPDDAMVGMQFQNNIVGNSDDLEDLNQIGILCNDRDFWPGFDFNAFANNPGGHIVDEAGQPPQNMPPNSLLVDDHDELRLVSVSAAIDDDNFHLRWCSPLINRGRFQADENDPDDPLNEDWRFIDHVLIDTAFYADPEQEDSPIKDGSRNDIGVYGGTWAGGIVDNWFDFYPNDPGFRPYVGPDEGQYGFDPYCAIDQGFTDLSNDELANENEVFDRDFLEWDYYRISDWCRVPIGETFTIGGDEDWAADWGGNGLEMRNVYIEMDYEEEIWFDVYGTIEVMGEGDEERKLDVYFAPQPDPDPEGGETSWSGMWIAGNDERDVFGHFQWFNLSGANYGMYFIQAGTADNKIILEHFNIHDGDMYGVYAWNSFIQLATVANFHNQPDRSVIQDIEPNNCAGLYIESCIEANQIEVFDVDILRCSYTDEWPSAGAMIIEANGVNFDNVTAAENDKNGFYVISCNPNLEGEAGRSNDIYDNGPNIEEADADGAEIYLNEDALPDLNWSDISDSDIDEDYLIYREDTAPPGGLPQLQCTNCFWYDQNDPDPPPNNGMPELDWFHPVYQNENEFAARFNIADFRNERIDDLNSFQRGVALLRRGEYGEALTIFEHIIHREPNAGYAISAARYLPTCYIRLELELNDLNDFYTEVSEHHLRARERSHRLLSFACRRMIPQVLIHERRYEEAHRFNSNAIRNSPFERERILAEISNIRLERVMNNERGALSKSNRLANEERVSELLKNLEKANRNRDVALIPTEFALANAYPNPFNGSTTISYDLPEKSFISLKLFDISGREITTLVSHSQEAGNYRITWSDIELPSGIYLCRMEAGEYKHSIKLVLIR
ncbi:MAG: T9SS type A sorting domain-containing protein [Candidatus Hatepunaea meridiana]|nr:T9SS type A sorting domain-containing protein [Candidatus Hatepunaea meridiana]